MLVELGLHHVIQGIGEEEEGSQDELDYLEGEEDGEVLLGVHHVPHYVDGGGEHDDDVDED